MKIVPYAEVKELIEDVKVCTIFEIYTKHPETGETGWDIHHVIILKAVKEAIEVLKEYPNFDCIITVNDWFCKDESVLFN